MKKQAIVSIAKKLFFGNLLAAAMFLSAQAAPVNTNNNFGPEKAEVKYTGVDKENQLSFKVKYSNPTGSNFSLSILDENGDAIYKGYFSDKNFDKTVKLPKFEANKLSFLIEDGKNSVKEQYTVNIKTSVQEEVTVSRN
jgi:hypothetical protein